VMAKTRNAAANSEAKYISPAYVIAMTAR
jgi:hypothetical protein